MNTLQKLATVQGTVSVDSGVATLEDGTSLDLVAEVLKNKEVLAALREVIRAFQTGDHSTSRIHIAARMSSARCELSRTVRDLTATG